MSTQPAGERVAIIAARRTPLGAFQGQLAALSAPHLAAAAIRGVVAEVPDCAAAIDELILGCVLPAGLGQAPARQAALAAQLPESLPCTTVNKVCGSGMKAVMLGADQIRAGSARVVLAGGMESMSNAPYLLPKARGGYRLGHGQILDHMFLDGLQSPWDGQLMGCFAEQCADHYGFTREAQDAYAAQSVLRAQAALAAGAFAAEITPVSVPGRGGEQVVREDESPKQCDLSKIPRLKAVFRDGGTVTAANSSSISDGAAVLLLASEAHARQQGWPVLAYLTGQMTFAQAPAWFTTAPVGAIRRLQELLGWEAADVGLYEINEAFAVVVMAALRDLDLPPDRVNVHGGACALGHPIGASGARIIVTLLHALRRHGLERGIASLCLGGGEATALALELA